ncbi:unnamed protein product, partial [marine sediment metagenome]
DSVGEGGRDEIEVWLFISTCALGLNMDFIENSEVKDAYRN